MKKITFVTLLLIGGLVATSAPAFAQAKDAAPANWTLGDINLTWLTRDDPQSSRFEEYKVVPKNVSMPSFFVKGYNNGTSFFFSGKNVSQTDQRYSGYVNMNWLGVTFDYNQTPHNMGNHAHSIETEIAPGVWVINSNLRTAMQNAVDAQFPTTLRTYTFYQSLFTPMIQSANVFDLNALRQHGNYEAEIGQKLPFSLKATYERDVKTGYRGAGGGVIYSAVNSIVELPESLDEVTQDVGLKATLNKKWGNAYATFNHNWYNNRLETTLFDNPLRGSDRAYTTAVGTTIPVLGGPGTARLIGPPDNDADRGAFGLMLKFKKQTRVSLDVAMGQWNQNADLYPYTSNSTVFTTSGAAANTVAALDKKSLEGKIRTTTLNFGFTSRPIDGLGLRVRYRSYDVANKTPTFVRTGSVGNAPDRSWTALTAANLAAEPFGWATASPYGSTTKRFDAQASYEFNKMLTVEGTYRNSQLERTYREASKGTENGESITAILHANDMLLFRGTLDKSKRTASGYDKALSIGLQADESERETTRVGGDLELMPNGKMTFTLAYARRNDDYPNRPDRSLVAAGTVNGLLKAKYDTYTVEGDFTLTERAELGAYYTYEKNLSKTQTGGTGTVAATALASLLTFDGSDKTNTYGAYANFVLVPEKFFFDLTARRQKLDGLMDITGDPAGSFALARVAYGGIQDIADYNDTDWTTITVQLRRTINASWHMSVGYQYDKYVFADAYSIFGNQDNASAIDGDGGQVFPATGGFYLKANDGNYKANVFYVKMGYKF